MVKPITGILLFDQNALKPEFWHSQGLLGKILETVRNILATTANAAPIPPAAMDTTPAQTQAPT